MRQVWWVPEPANPADYEHLAVQDGAEVVHGLCPALLPHLEGNHRDARLVQIPEFRRFFGDRFRRTFYALRLIYEDEFSPEQDVVFEIEKQVDSDWVYYETVTPKRVSEWTQIAELGYQQVGIFRAFVAAKGQRMDLDCVEFFYHE